MIRDVAIVLSFAQSGIFGYTADSQTALTRTASSRPRNTTRRSSGSCDGRFTTCTGGRNGLLVAVDADNCCLCCESRF
jgi:hypothetical protein